MQDEAEKLLLLQKKVMKAERARAQPTFTDLPVVCSEDVIATADSVEQQALIYKIALTNAQTALQQMAAEGPLYRPEDYFVEMVKSDKHMQHIRKRLVEQEQALKNKMSVRNWEKRKKKIVKRRKQPKPSKKTMEKDSKGGNGKEGKGGRGRGQGKSPRGRSVGKGGRGRGGARGGGGGRGRGGKRGGRRGG